MKDKKFLTKSEHVNNVTKSLEKVYNVVSGTMGPAGKNVLIEREYLPPIITKDGATVADHVYENSDSLPVISLLKSITRKVATESGDGTTSTTVMAYNLYKRFMELQADGKIKGIRTIDIVNELRYITEHIIEILNSKSVKIKSVEELHNIVKVSTNYDEYMTDMIIKALNITNETIEYAKDRDVLINISKTGMDHIEIVNGSRYDSGYMNAVFCNDKTKTKVEYENPYVVVIAEKVFSIQQIVKFLEIAKADNRPIVFFCTDMDTDVLSTLGVNKLKQVINCAVINAPGSGGSNTDDYLEDIALLAGTVVIKSGTSFTFDNISERMIGKMITNISSEISKTTITSKVDKEIVRNRLNELEEIQKETQNDILKESINKRMNKLKCGISNIYIASNSDVELFERRDRLEDAIGALKSALLEGYVPGSAKMFCYLSKIVSNLKPESDTKDSKAFDVAKDIVSYALNAPLKTILSNADILPLENDLNAYFDSIKEEYGKDITEDNNYGINAITSKPVDLIKEGIIDPTKVVRCVIEYSISLISTIISSNTSILFVNRTNE